MKSIIIKNERVFVLTNSTCDIFAFNLSGAKEVIEQQNEGYFSIFNYWNGKPKKISVKQINDMLQANKMPLIGK